MNKRSDLSMCVNILFVDKRSGISIKMIQPRIHMYLHGICFANPVFILANIPRTLKCKIIQIYSVTCLSMPIPRALAN